MTDAITHGHRARSSGTSRRPRRARPLARGQAQAARLAARRHRPAGPRRRHRADRAVPDADDPGRLGGLRRPPRCCCSPSPRSTTAAPGRPRTWAFLRRFDHANIFLLIAGSYTPFTLILLEGTAAHRAAGRSCGAARVLGVVFRVFWTDAPRWLYTPIYIALGWAAIFFVPRLRRGAGRRRACIAVLIVVGGGLYTLGGVVYGFKRPEPVPALVRLPRGLPHASRSGVRQPLRRRLAGDVLPALSAAPARLQRRVSSRRTVGDRPLADQVAADVRRRRGRRPASRPASSGIVVAPGPSATTTTAPGSRARAARSRASRSGPGGPTTATSSGPSSIASAAASDQPANRGACSASARHGAAAPPRRPSRCRPEPVSAAYVDAARAPSPTCPDGLALSEGSRGRATSASASSAVSWKPPSSARKCVERRVEQRSGPRPARPASPVACSSARKPGATQP